ncbi:uncharacterized protein LOC102064071 isoform X2 [Zonotrichia albicollis]|uniref:DUF4795 domain-containing protein n=1 Tax=Zonotrichia albicollis TaxID=44394 RepID=A0A8D2N703_ZONAL
MASGSLFQLLDEAIGTPEVNVNLEALRRLLRVILEHLSLLGLQGAIPQEGAQEAAPAPGQSPPAEAWDTGQPPQPPGEDELQGTRSGSPVTSEAADMVQMEKTDAKESGISKESHKEMAGIKAMQFNMGKEIQRIKEALGQTTDLCKDLCKEINEMKATQSRMGEEIRMIQEALHQGNLQDAAGQPLVLHSQPAPAKPYTSDMDKLGQSPAMQSTTPGVQTGTSSVQSGTTVTQPGFQAGLPTMESILRDLSELQSQMSSLQNLARDLQGEKEKEEELLKSIQATVVRVEGDCEQLGYLTGSLRDDHRQHQRDIEALFRSLEGLEKKADKEDLLLLKLDKAALGSKVNCAHFDETMEHLEERMRELLRRVQGQEQRWQEAQQQFSDALDSKLNRLELGPFQKQLEDNWAKIIKDLKDELTVEIGEAAGIKKQLLVPFKCLSCDRQLNVQVPGPHIDTLPLIPSLPGSHAPHPSTSGTEEQAQQNGHRKLVNSKFLKSQSYKGQDTSSAPLRNVLQLSKKPSVIELLSRDDGSMDQVEKRAQDELGPTTLEEDEPASDVKN